MNLDLNTLSNLELVNPFISTELGYNKIALNFGGRWNWDTRKDTFGLDLDFGVTDAASIKLETLFSGVTTDIFNLSPEGTGAYFLTNLKINEIVLSLTDDSLRNRVFKAWQKAENKSLNSIKAELLDQIDTYTATASQTKLFSQYKRAVVRFINGAKKISIKVNPKQPISVAELTPYFLSLNFDQLINVLNLKITN